MQDTAVAGRVTQTSLSGSQHMVRDVPLIRCEELPFCNNRLNKPMASCLKNWELNDT